MNEVPGLFTQTRRWDPIEGMVRDALLLFPEVESDPEQTIVSIVVDPEIAAPAHDARKLRPNAEQSQAAATKAMIDTAKKLSSQGLPYRDIEQLLGVSF